MIKLAILAIALLSSCGAQIETIRGLDGKDGVKGDVGAPGRDGTDGHDGVGCSVQSVAPGIVAPNGGALITCGDTNTLVLNGIDGMDGQDGEDASPTAYSITELVDPCGDALNIYDEVLLKMGNGMLVASFSDNQNGKNTRLSVVVPGTYQTTDGSNCIFTVQNDNSVVW